jgi:cytochrome P450
VTAQLQRAPGPRGHWLLGSLPGMRDPLPHLISGSARYGDITHFRIGPPLLGIHAHLLRHPDLLKHVFVDNHDNYKKGLSNDHMLPMVGQGILTAEGQVWSEQRKSLLPLFRAKALLPHFAAMNRCIDRHMTRWEELADTGTPTDVAADILDLGLEIAARVLFNFDISAESSQVSAALSAIQADVIFHVRNPLTAPRWLPVRQNRVYRRARVLVLDLVSRMIDHVRGQPEAGAGLLAPMVREGGGKRGYEHLQHQVLTMLMASHETTASALSWAWYLLSQNPDAERRLHEEIDSVLGDSLPGAAELEKLDYTRQCFLETLRLYPPAWCIERRAIADDVIAGYRIKAGDMVLLSSFVAHRNPEFWQDPDEFNPSRFDHHHERTLPQFVFFPFGGGTRRCIGVDFAMIQSGLILARIAQRWRLSLVEGHPVATDPGVTLRAKHGMRMRFSTR